MKSIILSFPQKEKTVVYKGKKRNFFSLADFIRRYLPTVLYVLFFTAGIIWGAIVSVGASDSLMQSMDFLFTTNLESRLSQGMFSSFAAHFASNFIFFAAAFLCALAPWGVGVLPLIAAFKGFGTGLSAAYLISSFGLRGFGFYLVVLLPGTFIFSMCLVLLCIESNFLSLRIAKYVFSGGESTMHPASYVRNYMRKSVSLLLVTGFGAICDMFLWSVVSGLFF